MDGAAGATSQLYLLVVGDGVLATEALPAAPTATLRDVWMALGMDFEEFAPTGTDA